MKISIVATLYNSISHIDEFYNRTSSVARQFAGDDYEIILVNDGSPDNSIQVAMKLAENDDHLVIIDLSRNFGHHNAMRVGLEHSSGDYVFLIDCDLEEEPEWLLTFSEQMNKEKVDVVYGVQEKRKGVWFERWSGELYYTILNWLLSINHPRNITTARLMSRVYVDAFLKFKELETVISCLWVITGFKQSECIVKKHSTSRSNYGFFKKTSYLVKTVTSFSVAPLKTIFFCGIIIFLASLLYAIILIINRIFGGGPLDGWTSIMVSIWILGGMIISFIGVIGIYLSKIYFETKQRPYVIVRGIYGKSN